MYNFTEIEKKWQNYWKENNTFKVNIWDFSKPKYYALDMFPYPSGVGLHAGHPEGYTATDIMFCIQLDMILLVFLLNNMQYKQEIILLNLHKKISKHSKVN